MMDNLNSVDSIMNALNNLAESKQPIDVNTWMNAAEKLNVLLQSEQDLLANQEHELAKERQRLLESGKTAAYTKMVIEADPRYLEARMQKAKIERVVETIRLAKRHATLASELMRNQM